MPGSHRLRSFVFLLCGALGAVGCVGSTDTAQGETGALSLDLVLADGTLIDEVDWQITGNGMDMSGTIDVSAPGSTASVEVFGLPKGDENYTIALEAVSVDREVSCRGSEPFNVEPGETTDVMVILNCKLPQRLGAVRVNGKFNICAELIKAVVSPLQTSVGNDIDLASQAVDQEGDPITFTWTATGGTIADPAAASTTYTCVDVGDHFVNISVTDNDEACDMAEWTIPVTCVQGDGGTGGSGGDGGTGGQGGAGGEAGAGGQGGAGGEAGAGGGTGGQGGAGGGIDPDIVCNEGVCLTDAGKKAECVAFLVDCLENNSDLNDDECVIGALLICEPDPCDTIDCSDSNECTDDLCADGVCSNPPVMDGNMCDGTAGVCESGVCVPADLCVGKDCSDDNECTQDLCDSETGICSNPNETDGTSCTCPVCGAEGMCMMGECVDPCEGVDCSDDNQCTADLCDLGICSNPNLGPGATCDQDGGVVCDGSGNCVECNNANQCPSAGECQVATCESNSCGLANAVDGTACGEGGMCMAGECQVSDPVIGEGSGSTGWRALPKGCPTAVWNGNELDTCTCPPGGFTGDVPGGGTCGAFSGAASVVAGCEAPGGVLNQMLALDTFVTLSVSSTGTGDVDHSYRLEANAPLLSDAAALTTVDDAQVFSDVTSGSPAQLVNSLNAACAGQLLGVFTQGTDTLLLDADPDSSPGCTIDGVEILPATTAVLPTSSPTVDINFSGNFAITLTLSSGDQIIVDGGSCIFDNPTPTDGSPITLPVN